MQRFEVVTDFQIEWMCQEWQVVLLKIRMNMIQQAWPWKCSILKKRSSEWLKELQDQIHILWSPRKYIKKDRKGKNLARPFLHPFLSRYLSVAMDRIFCYFHQASYHDFFNLDQPFLNHSL